jgi:hypothetical protein
MAGRCRGWFGVCEWKWNHTGASEVNRLPPKPCPKDRMPKVAVGWWRARGCSFTVGRFSLFHFAQSDPPCVCVCGKRIKSGFCRHSKKRGLALERVKRDYWNLGLRNPERPQPGNGAEKSAFVLAKCIFQRRRPPLSHSVAVPRSHSCRAAAAPS